MKERKNAADQSQYLLSTVDTTLDILSLFLRRNSISASDVAEMLDISRTVAFRHLYTLCNKGFLNKGSNDKYYLGMRFYSLGRRAFNAKQNNPRVESAIQELMKEINETIHLCTWETSSKVILLNEYIPHQSLRYTNASNEPRFAHMTSTGLALLSTMSDEDIDNYIKDTQFLIRTEYSIKNGNELKEAIKQTKENGYSFNREMYDEGVISIAMPIRRSGTYSDFAISISGPASRISKNMDLYIDSLKKCVSHLNDDYI